VDEVLGIRHTAHRLAGSKQAAGVEAAVHNCNLVVGKPNMSTDLAAIQSLKWVRVKSKSLWVKSVPYMQ